MCRVGLAGCDSRQDLAHDTRGKLVGQALVPAIMGIDQAAVIHSDQVEDGCVQVMYTHAVLHGLVANLVRGSMHGTALDAGARQPDCEPGWPMVASCNPGIAALGQREPPEFPMSLT